MTERSFDVGTLVVPSDKHRRQFPAGIKRRFGKIVGVARYTDRCWVVKWDNIKQPETLHESFLHVFGEQQDRGRNDPK